MIARRTLLFETGKSYAAVGAAADHPPLTPVNGINHCLGSKHPEAVLFSNHIMERFGGVEAARRDFGGYLMDYSQFLDAHLEQAREIQFKDQRPIERRRTVRPGARRAAWNAPEVQDILNDTSLSSSQVAERLGVSGSIVRKHRERMGVAHARHVARRVFDENEMAVLRDVSLSSRQVSERLGMTPGYVRKVRSEFKIKAPRSN